MSFNIGTSSLPEAFVGVPYFAEVFAGGVLETPPFTYVWGVSPKGIQPVSQPDPADPAELLYTGLPNGLTWVAINNVLTITGTPLDEGFGAGSVVYPSKQAITEFRVSFSSELEVVSTVKEIPLIINRIVNETSAKNFLDSFQESNGYISEEKVYQAIDGIIASTPDLAIREQTINAFAKNIGVSFMRQDPDGSFNVYYEIEGSGSIIA